MSDERFSGDEQAHYARHFLVKGFGPEARPVSRLARCWWWALEGLAAPR